MCAEGLDYRRARVRAPDRDSGTIDYIMADRGEKLSAAAYIYVTDR